MPHNIRVIRIREFLRTDVAGVLDMAASVQVLKDVARSCAGETPYHVLLDMRQASAALSVMEVFELASSLEELGIGIQNRLAILAPPVKDFDRASFFETVAQNRGFRVRALRDFEQAIDWLADT